MASTPQEVTCLTVGWAITLEASWIEGLGVIGALFKCWHILEVLFVLQPWWYWLRQKLAAGMPPQVKKQEEKTSRQGSWTFTNLLTCQRKSSIPSKNESHEIANFAGPAALPAKRLSEMINHIPTRSVRRSNKEIHWRSRSYRQVSKKQSKHQSRQSMQQNHARSACLERAKVPRDGLDLRDNAHSKSQWWHLLNITGCSRTRGYGTDYIEQNGVLLRTKEVITKVTKNMVGRKLDETP